jgi:hypothetical protein
MTYYIDYLTSANNPVRAFNYDADAKSLVPTSDAFEFETGVDYIAIKVDGDYLLVCDEDGLLCGDVVTKSQNEFPRLDIIAHTCGVKQRIASITQEGKLITKAVTESETLPEDSMNLDDRVAFSKAGVTAPVINEVWFATDEGGNYLVNEGSLLRVRI